MATGIEASGAPKPYEFGDTMNIDAGGTILNAVLRVRQAASGSPAIIRPAGLAGRGAERAGGSSDPRRSRSPSTSTTKT